MVRDDEVYLKNILYYASLIKEKSVSLKRSDLDDDPDSLHILLYRLLIIGEAARQVSSKTQTALPSIDWKQIINLRNRIVHAYFHIDLDVVWDVVDIDIPRLIVELEKVILPE